MALGTSQREGTPAPLERLPMLPVHSSGSIRPSGRTQPMPTAPRPPAVDKRALLRMQADLRRLTIIRTNQGKLVLQMQELVARYNKSETLANNVQKKVDDTMAGIIDKLG
jgi:hypothetical protein